MDTSIDVSDSAATATPPVTDISSAPPKLMKSVYVTARIKGKDKGIAIYNYHLNNYYTYNIPLRNFMSP